MKLKDFYDLSDEINSRTKSLSRESCKLTFKLTENKFNKLKNEITSISNHVSEVNNFNNETFEISIDGIKFEIKNYDEINRIKNREYLRDVAKTFDENGINLNKLFFVSVPSFVILTANKTKILNSRYITSASNLYSKRSVLTECLKKDVINYAFMTDNDISNNFFETQIITDEKIITTEVKAFTVATFSAKTAKEKYELLKDKIEKSTLGIFLLDNLECAENKTLFEFNKDVIRFVPI